MLIIKIVVLSHAIWQKSEFNHRISDENISNQHWKVAKEDLKIITKVICGEFYERLLQNKIEIEDHY